MAITKTDFINYSRCPRYVSLDNLKKEKLQSMVTIEEYKKQEEEKFIREILGDIYDEEDLIDVKNEHLEIMMPYYSEIETLTGKLTPKYFKGTFKYAQNTKNQESFDCLIDNIRYLCYVDIYNETGEAFNIIEVKATTTKKYLDLAVKDKLGNKNSIFMKDETGIYKLLEEFPINIEDYMPLKKYEMQRNKLFDKYSSQGRYVYDLAIQRYIIENDLKQNNQANKVNKIKYYLATLNSDYVFDGTYKNGKPVYNTDENGNEIISFIDLTSVTQNYIDKIDLDRKKISGYIKNLKIDTVPLGSYCEKNKTTKCKYCKVCWKILPEKNSILTYFEGHHGFKDENGKKYERFDLLNSGYYKLLDVPLNLLNREKNIIQRKVVETEKPFINSEKIKDGLKQLEYPIYHLDFETFPCPLPRYHGEKAYTQSVFQFSIHIEKEEGICDKNKDHFEFLAPNHDDHRLELVKKMCEIIGDKGTVLVYNESFEKSRLKELADIFPQYKIKLLQIRNMIFDLMNIVKTKTSLYEELGYEKEEASMFNYYHTDLNGSYSIKKVLPLFSNLSYEEMEIGNGIEALITYAKFPKMGKIEYEKKYKKMIEYCKQDTWAMVCVIRGLRNLNEKEDKMGVK